jgi:hypothetical protein
MKEPITLTGLLALYGAVLSSIGLGWNLYRDLHDRARLKLTAQLRRIVPSALGGGQIYSVSPDLPIEGRSDILYVFMTVTNVGRRPVRWNGWGGEYSKPVNGGKSFVVVPVGLPKMLNEGESHSEFTDEVHGKIDNIRRLKVWDASGKSWYVPWRMFRKLKKEIEKHHLP